MKAVVLAAPEDLRVESVPEPEIENPDDAIVRVTGSAVCGADLFPYHGRTPGFDNGTILGHEFVGVVQEAGPAVGRLRPPFHDEVILLREPSLTAPLPGARSRRSGLSAMT